MMQPPAYTDLPPTYDASIARISPLDSSLTRSHIHTFKAVLLPYRFIPLWEFPMSPIPEFYVDSIAPGWNVGISECNQALRIISSRQLYHMIVNFLIVIGCVLAFFIAALTQRSVILVFENSKIVVSLLAAVVIGLLLFLSHTLKRKILSIHLPLDQVQKSVDRMGWVLDNFIPKFGLIIPPEIQIIQYEHPSNI